MLIYIPRDSVIWHHILKKETVLTRTTAIGYVLWCSNVTAHAKRLPSLTRKWLTFEY
jgi:hypothetical protein